MGNSLRCCLACVLPCGALDLIRIVHLNGYVEELTGPITAGDVLKNNPNHVLTKPSSQGVVRRILILSPESDLKRGSIYFLIPDSSMPGHDKTNKKCNKKTYNKSSTTKKQQQHVQHIVSVEDQEPHQQIVAAAVVVAEKKLRTSHRRRSSTGTWQPYLESISEGL